MVLPGLQGQAAIDIRGCVVVCCVRAVGCVWAVAAAHRHPGIGIGIGIGNGIWHLALALGLGLGLALGLEWASIGTVELGRMQ